MDAYTFVKMMEERKQELMESTKSMKERDIVQKIENEVNLFKKKHNNRTYIYYGLRGIGKTTAMIQALSRIDAGYIDGSIMNYYNVDLLDVIREYTKTAKKDVLFVDEITEVPRWGSALKSAYDSKRVKVIATGSSAIKIATERNKIVRRAILEEVPPLTFGEFMRIFKDRDVQRIKSDFLISKPADAYVKARAEYVSVPDLTKELREYMQFGFPLYHEMGDITRVSDQILSTIITKDMPSIEGFNLNLIDTMERMVYSLVVSPPGVTSVSKLAEIGDCSKTTASSIMKSLEIASLFIGIPPNRKGTTRFRKEKKYLFSSPALRYGFLKMLASEGRNVGALREDLFVSTLHYLGYGVTYPVGMKKSPDYVVEKDKKKQVVEVGGPGKTGKQIDRGIVVVDSDRIDYANGKVWIPLYLVALMG